MLKILQLCNRQIKIPLTSSNNSYLLNTIKPRLFFKKKDGSNKAIDPITKLPIQDNVSSSIEQLKWKFVEQLNDPFAYSTFFHQNREQLPLFLRKITKILNKEYFVKNFKNLQNIYLQVNKQSSDLALSAQQFLQMLLFVERYHHFLLLNNKQPLQSARNGFQHRSSIMATNFLQQRQFRITQSILIFNILSKIGTICINFLTTFTKFVKSELQLKENREIIKIEHILMIINRYYDKQNRTVVENVLFDQTLDYLTKNTQLTKNISERNRLQAIFALLSINLNYCYLTVEDQRDALLLKLLKQVFQSIPDSFEASQSRQKQHNLSHLPTITLILQFWDKYLSGIKSISIQQVMRQISTKLSRLSYQIIISKLNLQKMSQIQGSILFRLVFSRQFLRQVDHKNAKVLTKKLNDAIEYQSSNFKPLLDRYYEALNQNKKFTAQIVQFLYNQLLMKGIFHAPLAKIIIQITPAKHINSVIDKMMPYLTQQPQNQHHLITLFALIIAIKHCSSIEYFPPQIFLKLQDINKLIIKSSKNSIEFIKSLAHTLQIFRDSKFYRTWLFQLIRIDQSILNHQINIPNQFERDRIISSYNYLVFLLETMNTKLEGQDKKISLRHTLHQIYDILLNLYPKNYPSLKRYHSSTSILDNQQNFISNFKAIQVYSNNIEKYYYHLWDLFIIFYIKQSQSARKKLFPTLKRIFKQAFNKQQHRKIVILNYLMNYIGHGQIIAMKSQLKQFFQQILECLVRDNDQQKLHYHCFIRIVFNALAAGILTSLTCCKIINRMINSNSFYYGNHSMLTLLCAGFIQNQNEEKYKSIYEANNIYLRNLQVNKQIIIGGFEQPQTQEGWNKKSVYANYKFISILLLFAQPQLTQLKIPILQYVRKCEGYKELLQMLQSLEPINYTSKDKGMHQFAKELNDILAQRLNFLKSKQLISSLKSQQYGLKIENNRKILNDRIL